MFGNRNRLAALETRFQALFENSPKQISIALPVGVLGYKEAQSAETFLTVEDDETAVALALISEFESLYKHYDNQKHHFGAVLILFAGGISSAPFLFDLNAQVLGLVIILSSAAICTLSFYSLVVLDHLRDRMKRMQYRVNDLRDYIDKKYPGISLGKIIEDSKGKASEKLSSEGKKINDKITRGAVWDVIPRIAIIYSVAFAILGVLLLFDQTWLLDRDDYEIGVVDSR